jgi:predicted double-glycine peptidase
MLTKAQTELGEAVADTTTRVVTQKVDTSSGAAAGVASVLANSTVYVTDAAVAANLGNKLEASKAAPRRQPRRC